MENKEKEEETKKEVTNKGNENVRNEKVSKFLFNFGLQLRVFFNLYLCILRFLKLVTAGLVSYIS